LRHAIEEAIQAAVDILDGLGGLLEHGIRKLAYFKQRHLTQP
jgi:hypothetical protein